MPSLKIVTACEKVINDQTGPVSVISIFQRINVQLTGVVLPENALSPIQWYVFSLWENSPEDVGKQFTQVARVTAPDGRVFMLIEVPFVNNDADDLQHKTSILIQGMPIWKEGLMTVEVWLKERDEEVSSFHFSIKYVYPPELQNAESV